MLKDYLGMADEVEGVEVYPVKILEWDKFVGEAYKFLPYGYDFLKYRVKATPETKLFDFLVALISEEILSSNGKKSDFLTGMETMFSIATRQMVKGYMNPKTNDWWFQLEDGSKINRENYDKVREVIMRQNLIFEPIVAPDEFSQRAIDNAIAILNKKGTPSDMEAMLCAVCNYKGISAQEVQDYTYYQLRADFEMAQRIDFGQAVHVYRAQGAKIDSPNIAEELSIHTNPYGRERLFKRSTKQSDEKLAKMMQG